MLFQILAVLVTCLLASTVGAVCGVGGGVLIKPVLDGLGIMTVSEASFLSGCTVLCMSAYAVLRAVRQGESPFRERTVPSLGLGAAFGGIGGRMVFDSLDKNLQTAKLVQSALLFLLLLGSLVYTLWEHRIHTHHVKSAVTSALAGLFLGFFSAFLGIGGGPFNLIVLSFLFSMDTKTAARNSLCIILFSQAGALLYALLMQRVPPVPPLLLFVAVFGGLLGGIFGRRINQKLSSVSIKKLFLALTVGILCICVYNMLSAR